MARKQTNAQIHSRPDRAVPTTDPRDTNASLGEAIDAVGCGSGIDLGGTGSGIIHVRHGPSGPVPLGDGGEEKPRDRAVRKA
jgi:hypothetical protein